MISITGSTLFIVGSPFQCLCMLEAINHWQISDYDVMLNCTEINEQMISVLLKEKGIEFISNRRNHLIKEVLPLFISKHKHYRNVFIGNYYYLAFQDMALAYCSTNSNVIFLDDGTQALELFSNNPRKVKEKAWVVMIQALFSLYAFIKRINRTCFFTIYNVKSTKYIIERNSFRILKTAEPQTAANNVYIIGTNSSKLCLKDKEYSDLLSEVVRFCKEKYPNQDVYYCPHRGDTNNYKLKPFLSNYGVFWYDTKVSVEYDFVNNRVYPRAIIGFNSNALFTLHSLFPLSSINNVYFEVMDNEDNQESSVIRERLVEYGVTTIVV